MGLTDTVKRACANDTTITSLIVGGVVGAHIALGAAMAYTQQKFYTTLDLPTGHVLVDKDYGEGIYGTESVPTGFRTVMLRKDNQCMVFPGLVSREEFCDNDGDGKFDENLMQAGAPRRPAISIRQQRSYWPARFEWADSLYAQAKQELEKR